MSRCDGSCNTVDDPFGRICVLDKMEDVKLKIYIIYFNMTKETTEYKHILCELRYNSRQEWKK